MSKSIVKVITICFLISAILAGSISIYASGVSQLWKWESQENFGFGDATVDSGCKPHGFAWSKTDTHHFRHCPTCNYFWEGTFGYHNWIYMSPDTQVCLTCGHRRPF